MFDIDLSNIKSNNQKQYVLNKTKDLRPKVDYNAFYSAIVVNTNDFYNLGRVQIRIPSIHGVRKEQANYISDSELPWAKCGVFNAAGNDMGQFLVPEKGSRVFVTFEANDSSNPIYFGGIPTIIGKPKEYNDNPDIYNGNEIEITDSDKIKDIKNDKAMQIVYKSFKGATILINDKDGQENIKIIDASGQVFEMGVLNPENNPLPRRGSKENSTDPYRYIRLGNNNEYIEIIDKKISIVADEIKINNFDFNKDMPSTMNISNEAKSYVSDLGDNHSTSYNIIHNLNSKDIICEIYDKSNGQTTSASITRIDNNSIKVNFDSTPEVNQYRIVIIKASM